MLSCVQRIIVNDLIFENGVFCLNDNDRKLGLDFFTYRYVQNLSISWLITSSRRKKDQVMETRVFWWQSKYWELKCKTGQPNFISDLFSRLKSQYFCVHSNPERLLSCSFWANLTILLSLCDNLWSINHDNYAKFG